MPDPASPTIDAICDRLRIEFGEPQPLTNGRWWLLPSEQGGPGLAILVYAADGFHLQRACRVELRRQGREVLWDGVIEEQEALQQLVLEAHRRRFE